MLLSLIAVEHSLGVKALTLPPIQMSGLDIVSVSDSYFKSFFY